jgi:hypothetical protein
MDELIGLIRFGLRGYVHHGAGISPNATAFMLLALRPNEAETANATLICPSCVTDVARIALSVMDQRARGSYPSHSPGGAIDLVGPAPIYDLVGVSDLPFCAGCAECRTHIACNSGCSDCRSSNCPCHCRTVGHTPTEALVCSVCGTDLTSSDIEAINKEVELAKVERRIIGDGCARSLAAQWFGGIYDGMFTDGYAFVSTGAIPQCLRDAWELLGITDWSEADLGHPDHAQLVALDRYLEHHGPRGPVEGWADIWIRK